MTPTITLIDDQILCKSDWTSLYTYIYRDTPLIIVRGPEHGSIGDLEKLASDKYCFHYLSETCEKDVKECLEKHEKLIVILPRHPPSFLDSLITYLKKLQKQ